MPPLVIPNTAQVVCSGALAGGEVWANVFHVRDDSGLGVGEEDVAVIAQPFVDFYAATNGFRDSAWSLNSVTVRDISEGGNNVYSHTFTAVSGGSGAPPLPYECAAVITLHSTLNTRRGRGRTFQAGFTTAANGENGAGAPVIAPTAVTSLATGMKALLDALNAVTWPLGVASRADSIIREVVSGYVDNGWDTQRGRSDDIVTSRTAFSRA